MVKAALFDLDGVVLDTESQYSDFWGKQFRTYFPDMEGGEQKIKGMTLQQIFDAHFSDREDRQREIVEALYAFESSMNYEYIAGFESFVSDLRAHGVRTAVVTSSNRAKMENVYRVHPELHGYFDRILTSEDFARSKPHPDCYLKGAEVFGLTPDDCVAFEDSINGLLAVRAAGIYSVGLATTNSRERVRELADKVVDDFTQLSFARLKD